MPLILTATGTDVGKTLLSALIMTRYARELNLRYHKPVQTGLESDRQQVAALSGLTENFFISEQYAFARAASPHYAGEQEGKYIKPDDLVSSLKSLAREKVLIELAGGVAVPLTRYYTNLELMQQIGFRTVLVAATGLGTINHTVLSLRALQSAGVACGGVFFVGGEDSLYADNARTIAEMCGVPHLGEFFLSGDKLTPHDFQARTEGFDPQGKIRALLV